jgi:hypothetical protein
LNEEPVIDTGGHGKPALFRQVTVKVVFDALTWIIKGRWSFVWQKALIVQ